MSPENLLISEFLSYYCQLPNPPEYAVLIKGVWGIGKTRFVNDILEKLKEEGQEHLYVSLYGVTSIKEIESDFFRQLHPWLASKGAKLAAKLTKGIIKGALKVDFDGDGESDGTITAGVPSDKLIDSFKIAEGKLLVFDDIERCGIQISNLLGYINQFVEHSGFKAILIANEEEILRKEIKERENRKEKENKKEKEIENGSGEYLRIKEKIIGKTFEIKPEIVDAFNSFAELLQCDSAKRAINDKQEDIIQLFRSSNHKNLRILRNSLLELDRIFSKLSKQSIENKEFTSHFISMYLFYSFEILSGNIRPSEISQFSMSLFSSYLNKEGSKSNSFQKYIDIKSKYTGIDLFDKLFDDSIWHTMFDEGFVDFDKIEVAIANSKYFDSEAQPNWVRLWNCKSLSDTDFESVLKKVECEWHEKTFIKIGVIKHVVGLFLWLSENGLYQKSKDEIIASAKKYIDSLKETGNLKSKNKEIFVSEANVWGGLGFHCSDSSEFQEFVKYISEKEEEATIESYPDEAPVLLELMKNETKTFFRLLTLCDYNESRFYDVPIFTYIKPDDFVKVFLELAPDQRVKVSYVFKERYKYREHNAKLVEEIPFLEEVIVLLEKAIKDLHGKMSGYTIGIIVDQYVKIALSTLKDEKKKLSSCPRSGSPPP